MFVFLLYLIPILITGIVILRKITSVDRLELLLPAGGILGFVIFTFTINLVAFLAKGGNSILVAYFLTICLGFVFFRFLNSKEKKIELPKGRQLFFWLFSVLGWGLLIFWKSAHALIGSDVNLYYAIAHSFIKGNFPLFTPWQPGIPLSYHVGASELLGAFYYLSGLDFQYIHLLFSAMFIFFTVQITIWIIDRHTKLFGFLLSNLAAVVAFISFGFIYIAGPVFPVRLPEITSISQFVIWLRNLPTVNQAIEVYGAPANLDGLIYFIFHAFGLAIFFSLLVLVLNYEKEKRLTGWIIISVGLSVLALVNESLFIAAFPAIFFGIFLRELKKNSLLNNLKKLSLLALVTIVIIFFQGGIISALLNPPPNLSESVLILPKKEDIKEDFKAYHSGQQSSKLLPEKSEWLPLRWFFPGIFILLLASLIPTITIKEFRMSITLKILFIAGLSSLIAYNVIVPKFLVANGNRFLSVSFILFSLLLCLSLIYFSAKIKKRFLGIILLTIIVLIFIPTVLPSLALLSKTRFGENKLTNKPIQNSLGILWLKKNMKFNERVMVLDKNAPHPSGQERALVEAGVFAPVFPGDFRVFTIEASPEYIDIAYYLSPQALKKLQVSTLLVDNTFYESLIEIRKRQLENKKYFTKIFDNSGNEWIYKINNDYLDGGGELDGTLKELSGILTDDGKIYIDNEENFQPSFLRRPLIFTLREKKLYYLPQSGVYLNVEADINFHPPLILSDYDYLLLGRNTDPEVACQCEARLIWIGLKGQVFLWKANR